MKTITINDTIYEIIENDGDCFNKDEFLSKCTDYFYPYDYIFGDYSYETLRLKGFYNSESASASTINDIKELEDYKINYCSYGAKTFLLKKSTKRL